MKKIYTYEEISWEKDKYNDDRKISLWKCWNSLNCSWFYQVGWYDSAGRYYMDLLNSDSEDKARKEFKNWFDDFEASYLDW